jgi:protein required for attachment to host cells
MTKTWILIADAAQARLFEASGNGEHWTQLESFDNPEGRAQSRAFHSEASGGLQTDEGTYFRSAMEPLSIKKVESQRFARELSQRLDRGNFARLIIVAPPEFLGMLRKELSSGVKAKLLDSIAKDYTHARPQQLEKDLQLLAQLE